MIVNDNGQQGRVPPSVAEKMVFAKSRRWDAFSRFRQLLFFLYHIPSVPVLARWLGPLALSVEPTLTDGVLSC